MDDARYIIGMGFGTLSGRAVDVWAIGGGLRTTIGPNRYGIAVAADTTDAPVRRCGE